MNCLNNKSSLRQRGGVIMKVFVFIPVILVLVVVLAFGFYEGRKAYWDYQVKEMCVKDGGTTIYERVVIDRAKLKAWGGVGMTLGIPHESAKRLDIPFFRRTTDKVLHKWNPQVMRLKTEFIRRHDKKTLGESIYYIRRGGDFPTWAHPSSFGCAVPKLIEEEIFIVKEKGNG